MAPIEWEPEQSAADEAFAPQPDLRIRREHGTPADLDALLRTPVLRRAGVQVRSRADASVVVGFDVSGLTNWWKVVHGGAIAMVADITSGVALHALLPAGTPIVLADHDRLPATRPDRSHGRMPGGDRPPQPEPRRRARGGARAQRRGRDGDDDGDRDVTRAKASV